MTATPPSEEAEVQRLLQEWNAEEPAGALPLTRDQWDWLYRAVHIFQAHEKQMRRSASAGDRIATEAMVRYITERFDRSRAPFSDER